MKKKNSIILNYVSEVIKVIRDKNSLSNRGNTRYLVREYISYLRTNLSSYNHTKFIKSIKSNKDKYLLAIHTTGKIQELFENIK